MTDSRDVGSATVEFVLVAVLTLAIFLSVVQVGVAVHVRTTLVAATLISSLFPSPNFWN